MELERYFRFGKKLRGVQDQKREQIERLWNDAEKTAERLRKKDVILRMLKASGVDTRQQEKKLSLAWAIVNEARTAALFHKWDHQMIERR